MSQRVSVVPTLVAAMLLTACGGGADPSASPAGSAPASSRQSEVPATPAASAATTPLLGPSPSQEPTPVAADPIPADAIVVSRVDGLRLRSEPGIGGELLGTLDADFMSLVVDGPEMRDGLEWYRIAGLGLPPGSGCATGPDPTNPFDCPVWLGWAARGSPDGSPWLEEIEPNCAEPGGPLDDLAFQPRYLYLACYGNAPITLRGHLVVDVGQPLEDPCPGVPLAQRWIACPYSPIFQLMGSTDAAIGLVMVLGPEATLQDGQIEVVGHYDDPAAQQCTYAEDPARSILDCRAQFVVDSGTPAMAP